MTINKEITSRYYIGAELKAFVLDNNTPIEVYRYLLCFHTDIWLANQCISLADIDRDKLQCILPLTRGDFSHYKQLWQYSIAVDDADMVMLLCNKCTPSKKEMCNAISYCAQCGSVTTIGYLYSQLLGGAQ